MLLGYGDGTFAPPIQFPVSFDPEVLVAKDLDVDGNIDLVIGHDTDDLVIVYYGRGDGTFDGGIEYDASDGPEGVIVEDFDDDGRLDIAIANDDDATLVVLMQRSDRAFDRIDKPIVAAEGTGIPNFANGAAAGQFTGDSYIDIAVFDRRADIATVHILAGRGDGKFEPSQSVEIKPVSGSLNPKAEFLAVADLDLDGDDDIVFAELTANRVWILWNNEGVFTPEERFFATDNPSGTADLDVRPAVIADFNGDRYPDIATVDKLFNRVTILYGAATTADNRSGAYAVEHAESIPVGRHPGTLSAVDFNGDGRLDLIVGNRGSYDLSILLGGEGGFEKEDRIGRTAGPQPSVRADFNRDGYEDVITTRDIDNDLSIELGRGDEVDGDGNKDVVLASNGVQGAVVNPIVVDLDGDGRDDVVSLNYRGEILVRFREMATDGDESLIRYAPPQIVNPGKPARDLALVRSGNGWQIAAAELLDDASAARDQSGRVGIYRLGNGKFERTFLATAGGAANLAAGDLDNLLDGGNEDDRRDELVVYSALSGEINVFRQDDEGRLTRIGAPIRAGASVADIALVNVAGGKNSGKDLVVTNRAAGMILVFVGNGDGTFATSPQIAARAGDETNWPYGYDSAARSVASVHDTAAVFSGRIDGDDSPDFVAINRATNSATVLLGKDRQTLSVPLPLPINGSPVAATIGDVNADELADLVLLYANGSAGVLLGDGHGGFERQEHTARVGQDAVGLRLAQADGDGVFDLVVSNRFGDVLTLLGNGDGTFREFRRADVSLFLVVEDIDGDGNGDYIFTNESRDRIEVRNSSSADFTQGEGDGLLAPGKAVVADLNRDGVLDFAVPNYGGNSVIVYVGVSPGKFAAGHSFAVGGNPAHASAADVNNDGIPDLVVADAGSNDVVVLYGKGRAETWTFDLGPRLLAGEGPVHTLVADATADGVPDIVVTNEREDTVFVLPGRGGGFFDDRADSIVKFAVGSQPVQSFVSGSGLATLNRGSNSLTYFPGMNPNTSLPPIPTYGQRPVSAVLGDFNFDQRLELVVAHELDGLFSVFAADADGFTLIRSQHFAELSHPTDLAVWDDRGRVSVFGVGDGREAAVLLFSAVPDNGFDIVRVASETRTDFVGFGDSFLPFVVGLLSGAGTGALGILIVEGYEGDSLGDETADGAEANGRDGGDQSAEKLPEDWSEELWPSGGDEFGPSEDSGDLASQLPISQQPPDLGEEQQGAFEHVGGHDVFFKYLEEASQDPSANLSIDKDVESAERTAERVDTTSASDSSPSDSAQGIKPAWFKQKSELLLDDSRRRRGDMPNQREQKKPDLFTSQHGHSSPRAPSVAAATLVFANMSAGWMSPKTRSAAAVRSRVSRGGRIREAGSRV